MVIGVNHCNQSKNKGLKRDHKGLVLYPTIFKEVQAEFTEDGKMTTGEKEDKKEYKQPVLFLRKSKQGKHLYAFNREEQGSTVLGGDVGSIIMDVSEVERLLAGSTDWIKVGVIPKRPEE